MSMKKKFLILLNVGIVLALGISIYYEMTKAIIFLELFILIAIQLVSYYFFSNSVYNLLEDLHELLSTPNLSQLEKETETEFSSLKNRLIKYTKIEELKRVENEQSKKQIEKLISDISHQTKTPIANIILYSELLLEKEVKEKKYVQTITNQAEKLQWLIQNLLHLSRLENGIIQCRKEVYMIDDIIVPCLEQYRVACDNKNLDLIYNQLKNVSTSIFADLKWTQEVLSTIIENSVKYTVEGSILVEVEVQELFVCIIVSDTGIGIDQMDMAHIFQRFYRSQKVKHIQGVGIGLSLAREIMEKQEGYMIVESKIDNGTKVKLFLPKEE
ncbi:HAMP domain-containing sensor histidine kinase [uncultured Vagococcus sp.]|uniref:sensor histidine kinase n=1 Tax=uncultured Vagococcus sp. TaxID=189676 RepID=UPI0028D34C1B|nr:HAMP domain-containing sensor histidine kinase [uncultured Vagococcus sp.]